MEDVKFTEWAALVADLFTFLGGMILAIDAVMAVRHFQEEEHRLKTFKSLIGKVRLETEDRQPINNENDVHFIFVRRLARWAIIGASMLVAGYLLQLITRIMQLLKK